MRPGTFLHLNVESKGHILVVTATGQISLEEALSVYKQSVDAAVERDLGLVLVDFLAVQGELSTLELYELGRTIGEYAARKFPGLKVATVGCPPLVNGFAAQVASNRGLSAETFSDQQQAVAWLSRFAVSLTEHCTRK